MIMKKKKILLGCAVIIFSPFIIVTVMAWAIVLFPSIFNDTRVSPEELAREHKGHKVNAFFTKTEYPDSCLDYLMICENCEYVEVKYVGYEKTVYKEMWSPEYKEGLAVMLFNGSNTGGTDVIKVLPPCIYDRFERKYDADLEKMKKFDRYK